MRKYLIYISLLCISNIVHAGDVLIDSFILKGKEAENVLIQCSRPVPAEVKGFWEPENEDIKELEKLLPNYSIPKDIGDPLNSFYAQYVGIIKNGYKYIYINFFHKSMVNTLSNTLKRAIKKNQTERIKKFKKLMGYWKTKAVNVCDGGDHYWGLVYDPKSKVFSEFQVNGFI